MSAENRDIDIKRSGSSGSGQTATGQAGAGRKYSCGHQGYGGMRDRHMGRRGPMGGHGPMGGMGMPAEKPKNFKKSLKRLIGYLRPHRANLIIVLALATAGTAFSILAPKISGKAMNKLQDGWMAGAMLKNIEEIQRTASDEIGAKLADVQKKAVESIKAMMEQAQKVPGARPASGSSSEAVAAMRDLLDLPMIDGIADRQERNETAARMLVVLQKLAALNRPVQPGAIFGEISGNNDSQDSQGRQDRDDGGHDGDGRAGNIGNIGDIGNARDAGTAGEAANTANTANTGDAGDAGNTANSGMGFGSLELNAESINALKEFLSLPMLDNVKDPGQKADICRKLIELGKSMPSELRQAGPADAGGGISLTQEQIDGAVEAIRETGGKIDFAYIGRIVLLLIGLYLTSSLFSLMMGLVMSGVSQKTVRDMRSEVDSKLAKLPLKYYDMHPRGDILSRVTNDIDTIAATLQQSLTQIITAVMSILGYVIMMLTISPLLTLIVVATLPLYATATTFIAKKSQKYFAWQQKELGAMSGHVEEMYTGHGIVKAFGYERNSIEEFGRINGRLYGAAWKAQFVSGVMFPLMNYISNLGYVMICVVGGIWITLDRLKIGDITAFIQYSRQFTMPIVQTAQIANIIQSTVACAERVFEVLDEPEEVPDAPDAKVIEKPRGEVRFEHVGFRYRDDVPLIEDMNIEVRQGRTIAIVGPTGAGKTTLVNLLMRFYEINAGRITVDGVDIRELKRSSLRRMFGMVLQDTWLFNGTIKDNIAYGKEGATMDEIVRAAKAAHADHFIRTLPDGYNTVLNEEATNISQGQKQLLTIARAVLADPAVLILDEATSSVDTRTEVLIRKAMADLMKGRTSFVIAHRLSTIRDAELILVMNSGRIVEMGSHAELLAKGGFYADLYNSQFAGADLNGGSV